MGDLREALQNYANDVIDDARYYMAADKINASGNLSKNLRYWIRVTKDGYAIDFGARNTAAKYARWAEQGRGSTKEGTKPGKLRPAIAKWILVKKEFKIRDYKTGRFLAKTKKNAWRAAYPIARKIHERGTRRNEDGTRGGRMIERAVKDNRKEYKKISEVFSQSIRQRLVTPKKYATGKNKAKPVEY
jgi:hypothetical protein